MDKNILVGLWRLALPVPPAIWKKMDEGGGDPLDFMSPDHQRVRDFAVIELALNGIPLTPERISQELNLPQTRVVELLMDLERHKTFLYRNAQGAVAWAYPVTVDETPHQVRFSYGEPARVIQVYAA